MPTFLSNILIVSISISQHSSLPSSSGKASIPSLGSYESLDGCYFSPTLVTDWFWSVVSEAVEELRRSPQRGIPTAERLERNGPLTTIILQVQTGVISQFIHYNFLFKGDISALFCQIRH